VFVQRGGAAHDEGMRPQPLARLTGLSPRRRAFFAGVALIVVALGVTVGVRLALTSVNVPARAGGAGPGGATRARSDVLLVPGYGGSASGLDQLAARIRATGRWATVVRLPGDGTGDLRAQAAVLNGYVNQSLTSGSGPVTVIGYSAGGVVAWLWDVDYHGTDRVRRFITLGSPLHGARLAALGTAFDPSECPVACQQLVPGSSLLAALERAPAAARPLWLSLWTTDDQVVQPPDSARLAGAVNVPLQSVCPGVDVSHGQLPTSPLVTGIVLRALSAASLASPGPGASQCQALQWLGR
jgi:triacylglycerol lipase